MSSTKTSGDLCTGSMKHGEKHKISQDEEKSAKRQIIDFTANSVDCREQRSAQPSFDLKRLVDIAVGSHPSHEDKSAEELKEDVMGFRAIDFISMPENTERRQKTYRRTLHAFMKKPPTPPTEPDPPIPVAKDACYGCQCSTIVENEDGELVCTTCYLVQAPMFLVDRG